MLHLYNILFTLCLHSAAPSFSSSLLNQSLILSCHFALLKVNPVPLRKNKNPSNTQAHYSFPLLACCLSPCVLKHYFSVHRVLHHNIFFSLFRDAEQFRSLPLPMLWCKIIVSFLFMATHCARISACVLAHAELSVSLYTLPTSVKFKICF